MELVQLGDGCLVNLDEVRSLSVHLLEAKVPGGLTLTFKNGQREVTLRGSASKACWNGPIEALRQRLTPLGDSFWIDLSGLCRAEKRREGSQYHLELEFLPQESCQSIQVLTVDQDLSEPVWAALVQLNGRALQPA